MLLIHSLCPPAPAVGVRAPPGGGRATPVLGGAFQEGLAVLEHDHLLVLGNLCRSLSLPYLGLDKTVVQARWSVWTHLPNLSASYALFLALPVLL